MEPNKAKDLHKNNSQAFFDEADVFLPVSLNLGNNSLSLTRNGQWHLESSEITRYEVDITTLQTEVQKLSEENQRLQEEHQRMEEEKNLVEFKNQILLEMLAIANLDLSKATSQWETEKLKTDALKWELSKRMLSEGDT